MLGILGRFRSSHYAVEILSKLWIQSYHCMSTCVLSVITMHVRCNYEKRKEIIGHGPLVTSIREVKEDDPQRYDKQA